MASGSFSDAARTRRAHGLQVAFALSLLIVVLRFFPGPQQRLFALIENSAYDLYFDHRPPRDISDFVIIAIDEESLKPEHLGRFPWDRAVYARMLAHLGGAKLVGLDLLFPEPSPDDAMLAAAIRKHGRVVLAAHKRRVARGTELPVTWHGYGQVSMPGLIHTYRGEKEIDEFVPPVPALAAAAAGVGSVGIVPDRDGIYRRVLPLQVSPADDALPHFGLEIARLVLGLDPAQIVHSAAQGAIMIKGARLPLDHSSEMLINYAGPAHTVKYVPAWRVAARQEPAATFRDKIVLIGPTAAGLYDVRPAPFARNNHFFLGVELNANIAHTFLTGQTLRNNTVSLTWALYALALGTLVGWAIWYSNEKRATWLGVSLVVLLALPVFLVAVTLLDQVVPYGAILLGAVIPMAWCLYERLGSEKRQVTRQFETYVSRDVLRELGNSPELVQQGQRREVTLLFSDVRGSTTIAEKLPPDVWIAQLNEYLSEMSDAIFAYDGYLDKFMGDGIMAMWNAFGNQPDHAELAIKSAVQMLERLKRLNEAWEGQEHRVPLQIGIGLHTGAAIIGNVGSFRRAQYTAIGDSVNSASRIEALTKEFRAPLLLSETTVALLEGKVKLVELGEAELKGRVEPIRIYKPEGYAGDVKGHFQQKEK
ncbi:MAG: CHASE2 domain-containing protein [Armatimonadetes bacterium]|nr:CHASE2 domain-containing protein [Armatimonadota bacterium]